MLSGRRHGTVVSYIRQGILFGLQVTLALPFHTGHCSLQPLPGAAISCSQNRVIPVCSGGRRATRCRLSVTGYLDKTTISLLFGREGMLWVLSHQTHYEAWLERGMLANKLPTFLGGVWLKASSLGLGLENGHKMQCTCIGKTQTLTSLQLRLWFCHNTSLGWYFSVLPLVLTVC